MLRAKKNKSIPLTPLLNLSVILRYANSGLNQDSSPPIQAKMNFKRSAINHHRICIELNKYCQ